MIVSGRAIACASTKQLTYIELCGEPALCATSFASFLSTLECDITHEFVAVVANCDFVAIGQYQRGRAVGQ